jgi:cobalt-zinc-cadmium efflux system outer membrane protein
MQRSLLAALFCGALQFTSAQTPPVAVEIPAQLTLEQAERLLVERNLAVAVNRRQVEAADAAKLIASYKPNPTLQIGAEQFPFLSDLEGSTPRFFSTNSDAGSQPTYTALFTKVIERGGKRELRTSQAQAQLDAAKAQVLDTLRLNLLALRQAFGAALLARDNLKLARLSLEEYEQTEKLTVTRVDNGDLPPVEAYRIRANKVPFQQAAVQAQTQYEQACLDVLNLLNAYREEVRLAPAAGMGPLTVEGDFSETPVLSGLPDLKKAALATRPDVSVARNNGQAANFGTRLAEAQRRRDLSVGYEYQRVGTDSAAGLILSIPLFLYNNQKAGIAQATALERAASLQVRQSQVQAVTDVEKAWSAYLAARNNLQLFSRNAVQEVEKLRQVAFFSFREGATSLFEFLDAQRTANATRQAYNQARADYQNALWQLEAAVGKPLREVN